MPVASTVTASVRLVEELTFAGESGSGKQLTLDANPLVGGRGLGFRPMELMLLSLAGCTAMDVIAILRKMRQDVTDYRVDVTAQRADEHPKVFTEINVEHVVTGHDLREDAVKRAVELSETRYCPASAMLSKAATVHHRYRLVSV
ncbi:MAG: OsmC family protein [Chloroflexi bacterium]|nr:OsmC family protein [Chloroflexota bacterium]